MSSDLSHRTDEQVFGCYYIFISVSSKIKNLDHLSYVTHKQSHQVCANKSCPVYSSSLLIIWLKIENLFAAVSPCWQDTSHCRERKQYSEITFTQRKGRDGRNSLCWSFLAEIKSTCLGERQRKGKEISKEEAGFSLQGVWWQAFEKNSN